MKEYVKEPYSKFDERTPEKWTEIVTAAKSGTYKVLQNAEEATYIQPDRILGKQLEGNGQFVEVQGTREDKLIKIGLVVIEDKKWILVSALE